jgi:hypothetical protein
LDEFFWNQVFFQDNFRGLKAPAQRVHRWDTMEFANHPSSQLDDRRIREEEAYWLFHYCIMFESFWIAMEFALPNRFQSYAPH